MDNIERRGQESEPGRQEPLPDLIPGDTVVVVELAYRHRAPSIYERNTGRQFTTHEGGDPYPTTDCFPDMGVYSFTDMKVTELRPGQWTTVQLESSSVFDAEKPLNVRIVRNEDGKAKSSRYNRRREKRLAKKGLEYVMPGSFADYESGNPAEPGTGDQPD